MKKLLEYIPFHFTVCLIVGIVFQFYTHIYSFTFIESTFIIAGLLILFYFLKNRVLRTFLSWIFFFFIGVWIVFLTNSQNHKNYFEKFVSKKNTLVLSLIKHHYLIIQLDQHINKIFIMILKLITD